VKDRNEQRILSHCLKEELFLASCGRNFSSGTKRSLSSSGCHKALKCSQQLLVLATEKVRIDVDSNNGGLHETFG